MGATLFMTKEQVKEKAIRDYPNGTEFECPYTGNIKTINTSKNDTYLVYGGDSYGHFHVDGGCMNGYLCYNNIWAKIISKPIETGYKLGETILYEGKEHNITGFRLDTGWVRINNKKGGHNGTNKQYDFDEKGDKITFLEDTSKQSFFVSLVDISKVTKTPKFKIGDRVKVCSDAEDINRWGYLPESKAVNLGSIERCNGEIDQQKIHDGRYYYRIIPMIGYICEDCLIDIEPVKTEENLIEEAKKRYPVGTVVRSPVMGSLTETIKDTDVFRNDTEDVYIPSKITLYDGMTNKWAEVVTPVVKSQYWVRTTSSGVFINKYREAIPPNTVCGILAYIQEEKKYFEKNSHGSAPGTFTLPTDEEIQWLERCISANKYLPKETPSITIASLPLKWCVKRRNGSDWSVISQYEPFKQYYGNGTYYNSDADCSDRIKSDYTEITLEQFKLWVLGEGKIEAKPYDLLAEARARYPKGTRFTNVGPSGGTCYVTGANFNWWKNHIYEEGEAIHDDSPDSNGLVYCRGKWAEVLPDLKITDLSGSMKAEPTGPGKMSWEEMRPSNKVVGKYPLTFEDIDRTLLDDLTAYARSYQGIKYGTSEVLLKPEGWIDPKVVSTKSIKTELIDENQLIYF